MSPPKKSPAEELKYSQALLVRLQKARTLSDLAAILEIKPSSVSYILYKKPIDQRYTVFPVRKKSGGIRNIAAPYPQLKDLQSRLSRVLMAIQPAVDHSRAQGRGKSTGYRPLSHGFEKGRSIRTNAEQHIRKRHVFNIDLEDFFPSFNFGRVRSYFIKNRHLLINDAVATVIAQIACYKNELPQGSPCSPVISNLIAGSLDTALVRLARKHGCSYSRYADDITFSTNAKEFPAALANWTGRKWDTGSALLMAIERSGFRINPEKTRMSGHKSRQTVTGLTVNRHVNIRQSYYRDARAMANSLFDKGVYHLPLGGSYPKDRPKRKHGRFINWLSSRRPVLFRLYSALSVLLRVLPRSRRSRLNQVRGREQTTAPATATSKDQLRGIISYIYNVKKGDKKQIKTDSGPGKLYRHFLLFDRFYAGSTPLIVCEGKTDNIYLKSAIRSLSASYPNLIKTDPNGDKRLLVHFLNQESQAASVLGLPGGEGHIRNFIENYKKDTKLFRAEGKKRPVIFVVDNDSGGKKVYDLVNGIFKTKLGLATGAGTTRLLDNLYLVSTDPIGPSGNSCSENFFDSATLGTIVKGRTFKFDGEPNPTVEYGKNEFAVEVVLQNQSSINFTGFSPLLDRIAHIVSTHK